MGLNLNANIPDGAIEEKWKNHKFKSKLVNPANKRKYSVIVVGTGRSDFDNQINNVLAFPGIFRGVFDVRASNINEEMKMAAAYAIANLIDDKDLTPSYVIPKAFDDRVKDAVASAVAEAARKSGVARI